MRKLRSGFLLVEFLIYLALLSLLSLLLMNITVSTVFNDKRKLPTAALLSLLNSFDLVAADIKKAPTLLSQWKKITEQELIWSSENEDIGWRLKKNILIRKHGVFDKYENHWIRYTKSVASAGIKALHFDIEKKQINKKYYVTMVSWQVESEQNLVDPAFLRRSVMLENKIII